jgi:GTP cyclohydrolase I
MGSGDSPPLGPKPKSALPSYLLNGSSSLRMPSNVRERESLDSSIRKSFSGRRVIDPDMPDEANGPVVDGHSDEASNIVTAIPRRNITEPPRDPRDRGNLTPFTASRPASPYTLNPPIDFDGLSWPST